MKAYDVPAHLQDDGSEDCGPASTTMVLDFFGITADQEAVIKKVPRCNYGTDAFGNALVMQNYGLSVEVITANPLIFDGDFLRMGSTKSDIRHRIVGVRDIENDTDRKAILDRFVDAVDSNIGLITKIPTAQMIIDALNAGKLVWTSMYAQVLGKNEGKYHFIVIGGYDESEETFLVFNPLPKSRRKSWEKIDEVMFAIHTNTLFDYDNGAVLVVGKQ